MIIGVTGPSGSGKTLVGKHLRDNHGFRKRHAGQPMKAAMRAGFPTLDKAHVGGDERIDEPHRAFGGVPPRMPMDAMSAALYQHAPKATAIALGQKLDRDIGKGRDTVVDGVRTPEEADAIHRRGGVILRVNREDGRSEPSLAMDKIAATVKADHTIMRGTGDGNKDQLRADVDKKLYEMMRP